MDLLLVLIGIVIAAKIIDCRFVSPLWHVIGAGYIVLMIGYITL